MGKGDGTIRGKLFAVRYVHLVNGYADPLMHKKRLWTMMDGLHRRTERRSRKHPTRPSHLMWIKEYLDSQSKMSKGDNAAVWAAMVTAWFYLLRSSEYLVEESKQWSKERCVKYFSRSKLWIKWVRSRLLHTTRSPMEVQKSE